MPKPDIQGPPLPAAGDSIATRRGGPAVHGEAVMRRRRVAAAAAVAVTATLGVVPVAPAPAWAAAPCTTAPQQAVASVPEAPWESRRFDPARLSQFSTGTGVTVAVIDSGVDP